MWVKQADLSKTITPRHNSTKFETEISCPYIGPETEMKIIYIENYRTFKLNSCV
jgi:hypothetical protein